MLILIIFGVIGLVLSSYLTRRFLSGAGIPQGLWNYAPGTGIVPSWVSLINIISWALLGIGILAYLFRK